MTRSFKQNSKVLRCGAWTEPACSQVNSARGRPRGAESAWREGGVGEDHRVPPSHPYCACARPLGCLLHPGTRGRGCPREGLYPRPWSCTTIENLYLWGSGRAERLGSPVSASLRARPEGHWMALRRQAGLLWDSQDFIKLWGPRITFSPLISFLFFSFFHPLVPSLFLSFPFCLTPFKHVYFS